MSRLPLQDKAFRAILTLGCVFFLTAWQTTRLEG